MPVAKDHKTVESEWYWEFSHNDVHQVDDAEDIRDHMFRAVYGSFANAKKDPKHATRKLKWVAHVIGKRESRRLMGDHIYVMDDAVKSRYFEDAVVMEKREVDVHDQKARKGSPYSFLSKAIFRPIEGAYYYVPFRSLYSRNIDNLMMAGRCFSCSHIGLGGPRVMKTCAQMGVAVGYAAALCNRHNKMPRGIYEDHLEELKELTGVKPEETVMRTSNSALHLATRPYYFWEAAHNLTENTRWWLHHIGARIQYREEPTAEELHHALRVGIVAEPEEMPPVQAELVETFGDRVLVQHFAAVKQRDGAELHVLEVFAAGVHKWSGLQWLAREHEVGLDEVAAIGDHINDLSMIEAAGCGIAMGNAVEPVRRAARHVTDSNDEGGVATAIDRILGGQW